MQSIVAKQLQDGQKKHFNRYLEWTDVTFVYVTLNLSEVKWSEAKRSEVS
jgi:hypothetical protein